MSSSELKLWTGPSRPIAAYMSAHEDESPLYLFDRKFAEKMGIEVGLGAGAAYWKPECFGPDLFEVLGKERPAHRWLIVGPERSGSTFHKDPNGTSAWNAVLQGAKYWIMFPPTVAVPGVYVSEDGGEVTSPLSIAEWLLEFHSTARPRRGLRRGHLQGGRDSACAQRVVALGGEPRAWDRADAEFRFQSPPGRGTVVLAGQAGPGDGVQEGCGGSARAFRAAAAGAPPGTAARRG